MLWSFVSPSQHLLDLDFSSTDLIINLADNQIV